MKNNFVLLLLILLISGFGVSCSKSDDNLVVNSNVEEKEELKTVKSVDDESIPPGQMYQKGLVYLQKGDIFNAEKYLIKAIDKDKSYFMGYNFLADYYMNNNHISKSMEYYNKALKCNPKSAKAYAGIGNLYFMEKKPDKAIENLEKAIELNPQYIEVYEPLSRVYMISGDKKNAIATLNKLKKLKPELSKPINITILRMQKAKIKAPSF